MIGPYDDFNPAYEALMKWAEANGYKLCCPPREIYLKGPAQAKKPEEYVAEIQIPVEKA